MSEKNIAAELASEISANQQNLHISLFEAAAANKGKPSSSTQWNVEISTDSFLRSIKTAIDEEFRIRSKEGETPFSIDSGRLANACEILTKVMAGDEKGKASLRAVAFEDGSGAFGYDFGEAPATAHFLNNLASPILSEILAQKETETAPDLSEMSLEDILDDAEKKASDKNSGLSPAFVAAHLSVVSDALTKAFSEFTLCRHFEPGLASLSVGESAEKTAALGLSMTRDGNPAGHSDIVSFFRNPGAFITPEAPKVVPRKDYSSLGQMVKASDAEALSDYIDTAKAQGIWGDDHDENATQLLWHAASLGAVDVARVLLSKTDADIKVVNASGFSCLLAAASGDHPAMIEFLIKERGFPMEDSAGNGMTALMVAASGGALKAIDKLVELGVDINNVDLQGRTALHWAAEANQTDAGKLLIEKGIDPTIEELIDGAVASEYVDEENDALYDMIEDYRASFASRRRMSV